LKIDILLKQAQEFKVQIEKISDTTSSEFQKIKRDLEKLIDTISIVKDSWSGSWIGFHANLYYRGFVKPKWQEQFDSEWGSTQSISDNWVEQSYNDIYNLLREINDDVDLSAITDYLLKRRKDIDDIRQDLCTTLSVIKSYENFQAENILLDKIEKNELGMSTTQFIRDIMPKRFSTRDSFAMSQGIKTPPHIQLLAEVLHLSSTIKDIEEFITLSLRLVKQLEIQNGDMNAPIVISIEVTNIINICNKFHTIARQIIQRHSNRPTIAIIDEYDVQDLFHTLLILHFDDIRIEEWTPSYAGSSARMDLLLKNEKTVIEIKKTRDGLRSKELGEQLTIDIAHYRQHPDCKRLFFFVYDVEGYVKNPRGFEKDIEKLSSDEPEIRTLIRPL